MRKEKKSISRDAQQANFREIRMGGIAPGTLYRSSHPIKDNKQENAVANLVAKTRIAAVINLADTDSEIRTKAFFAPWYNHLYRNNRIIGLGMDFSVTSRAFNKKLKTALRFIINTEGPWLIHCHAGADRTGFVSLVLESFMGASLVEIMQDYELSFNGITDQAVVLQLISVMGNYLPMRGQNLPVIAERYLRNTIGLSADEVILLRAKLSRNNFEKIMAGILNQDELDDVLRRMILSPEEFEAFFSEINGESFSNSFRNIAEFEKYLLKRNYKPEQPYGAFDTDTAICRFFQTDRGEKILDDIKRKNEEQGLGNIRIPNTKITLINYSFCPKCKTSYSFKEVLDYYQNPKPDTRYKTRAVQYRTDTRVCCAVCDTYFLPSIVISDGTPKNEVQFLCRSQTIDAIEEYFWQYRMKVLTKKKKNIIYKGNLRAIKNDVLLTDLEEKPTLITNMLQYTPPDLIQNLIDGTNVKKGDLLFNEWI